MDHNRVVLQQLTVRRRAGKWYVTFTARVPLSELLRPFASAGTVGGMDVGCETHATFEDGAKVARVRHLDAEAKRLREAQRSVSRKKKGSCNRRKDHLKNVAGKIVSRYSFLAVEDLTIRNMMAGGGRRKRGLNRSLADAALGELVRLICSKAEEAGCEVVHVDPRGTSQTCLACGAKVPKGLGVRQHVCACGLDICRDVNAARNILSRGLTLVGRESFEVWRDARPELAQAVSL